MPTPRKKRITTRPIRDLVTAAGNSSEQERGEMIQRFATQMRHGIPIAIPDDEGHVKHLAGDEDVLGPVPVADIFKMFDRVLGLKFAAVKAVPAKPVNNSRARINGSSLILGADPEFVVVSKRGSLEDCKSMDRKLAQGGIGYDHSGRCAEFRPNPGMPRDIIDNIRQLMVHVRDTKPGRQLVAGGCNEYEMACGGHIHFNIKGFELTHCNEDSSEGGDQSLIHALDSFLGRKMLRMEGAKRAKPNSTPYGFPGDWREQPHGFEYRTPPSFIGDPVFSEAVFCVAHRVAKLWMSDHSIFNGIQGRMAKRREYSMLVPTEAEIPLATDRDYWRHQIATFVRLAWDPGFKLNNPDMVEKWTAGIPVKAVWRTIDLVFPEDEEGMDVRGSITVPVELAPDITSITIKAMPEWQNFQSHNIVVSRPVLDAFRVATHRRDLERRELVFIATPDTTFVIGIPYLCRKEGNRYTHRHLERLFQGLGLEHELSVD